MSSFDNQRAPNVSEFVANLNAIPSAEDLAAQPDYNFDADLAMFTNTTFFDFDLGQDADLQPQADLRFNDQTAQYGQQTVEPLATPDMAKANMDFLQGDFTFPDFSSFSHQHAADAYPVDASGLVPLNTNHSGMYNSADGNTSSPNSGLASPGSNDHKRTASDMLEGSYGATGQSGFEDASRLAAEEDKRRRNTAASARFRVKKKQREQALEKSAKEMSDKVAALEGRINQLETENKWLKNLVMEKNDNKEDLAALWKKFSQENADRRAANAEAKAASAGGVVAKKEVQA